jgi:dihydroorotase
MILIHKATIINEGCSFIGSVLIENNLISEIYKTEEVPEEILSRSTVIDARNLW